MSGDGFLERWSRRKRGLERDALVPVPLPLPAPEAAPVVAEPPVAFDPATLPPVDTLTAASDLTAFLRAEVPAALRQAALRRMWTLDPAIASFIGPADYAWDFNAPDAIPGFASSMAGDMGRMLAQAIGEGPAAEPVEPADAIHPKIAETDGPAPVEAPATIPSQSSDEAAPPTELPRVRHGGAMPA